MPRLAFASAVAIAATSAFASLALAGEGDVPGAVIGACIAVVAAVAAAAAWKD